MARRIPTPDGVALTCLRSVRGWTQKDLAEASGTPRTVLSDYETGRRVLSREKLESLAGEMEFGAEAVEAARLGVKLIWLAVEESGSPLDLTAAERRRIVLAALEVAQGAITAVVSTLVRDIRDARARQDRDEAEVLWARLKSLPPRERRKVIEADEEYHAWALCERLCTESERAAAHDASRAKKLADLALRVADLVPGKESWRARLQGYAWAYIGNARRVASDLPGADRAFVQAWDLWRGSAFESSDWLEEGRMLDLEASLRREQRRFSEALKLLDQALVLDRGKQALGRIWLKKAFTLEQMGEYEQSIEALLMAASLIHGSAELRSLCVLKFNLAVNLCHLGRFEEAAGRVDELRELIINLANDLDLVRLAWLEGRVAAGLGKRDEAVALFQQVRSSFTSRGLAFDTALVSLELAVIYLEQGRTGEVRSLAREVVRIFQGQQVHREALVGIKLFQEAAEKSTASVELARRVFRDLYYSRGASRGVDNRQKGARDGAPARCEEA